MMSVAFCPVVTIALHWGSCFRSKRISVGSTTSRNLSEALSCKRLTEEAVSYRAIPFSVKNSTSLSLSKAFLSGKEEMVLVAEEDEPEDAPHIVLKVRIEEVHTPAFLLRRETAQHQQLGICRQEGFQRMFLDG